jgi:cell division protein ZapA
VNNVKIVTVKILSKELQVNCPTEAEEQLNEAALYLDRKMREIRNNGRVIGLEKMAMMAALNIAHELLTHRQLKEEYVKSVSEQIERLQNKLNEALIGNTATEISAD